MAKRGRPRKPSAIREAEGNRSRTAIPPDLPLSGLPEVPPGMSEHAAQHFRFVAAELGACGVVKRLDTAALSVLADCWEKYWAFSNDLDTSNAIKWLGKWMQLASRFGLTPSDRASLMGNVQPAQPDEEDKRYFGTVG